MIKVIASDMDGTLLGDDHRIAPETLKAVKEAVNAGIRFMICTGRNFPGAMQELEGTDLVCDYIVGSGAEVRDPEQNVVLTCPMSMELCRRVYRVIREYPVSMVICTNGYDYRIGTTDEAEESILLEAMLFHMNLSREEVKKTPVYLRMIERTKIIADLAELEEKGVPVYKLFLFSEDRAMLEEIRKRLEPDREIAAASSFPTNLELTDVKAQKGPVLKAYIESLGYTMDEVMVLGDSLNDLSMISMDFGATVAMENGDQEVKRAAKYITKTNGEFGVAYAIRELIKHQGQTAAAERNP